MRKSSGEQTMTKEQTVELLSNVATALNEYSKELWDILSALRGPDHKIENFGDEMLKEYTTARIRSLIGMSTPPCRVNNRPLDDEERFLRDKLLAKADTHFFNHYHSAVKAIRYFYAYDLEQEKAIKGE